MFSILIVDDNPPMASAMYDILLTDVSMPGMDGLELYRRTRQAYPLLITILMTADAADELIQQDMTEGIKTVLTKPIDIGFLARLLTTYRKRKAAGIS